MVPARESSRVKLPTGRVGLAMVLCCALAGCHQRLYYAHSLPPELMAARTTNVQRLDLSRLARSNVKSEVLYPGDMVQVAIVTGMEDKLEENTPLRVTDDGTINVPLVGPVAVAGLVLPDAERIVRDESIRRGIYRAPQVSIQLQQRRTFQVTVVGAVGDPGIKKLPVEGCDLLSAIVAAGALTKEASPVVEVRHPASVITVADNDPRHSPTPGQPRTEFAGLRRTRRIEVPPRATRLNLEEAANSGRGDFHLEDGSVVMVMKQPERLVHVMGLVRKADQIKMPVDHDLHLLDAIAMAGGRTLELADKVHVIRSVPGQMEPVRIEASIREAKQDGRSNIRLAEGDIVSVEETPLTFVVGTVRDFVRFGFTSAIPGL